MDGDDYSCDSQVSPQSRAPRRNLKSDDPLIADSCGVMGYCPECSREHDYSLYQSRGTLDMYTPAHNDYEEDGCLAPSHQCIPPVSVIRFGDTTVMTKAYRAALFVHNPHLKTQEIVGAALGGNRDFPSFAAWQKKRDVVKRGKKRPRECLHEIPEEEEDDVTENQEDVEDDDVLDEDEEDVAENEASVSEFDEDFPFAPEYYSFDVDVNAMSKESDAWARHRLRAAECWTELMDGFSEDIASFCMEAWDRNHGTTAVVGGGHMMKSLWEARKDVMQEMISERSLANGPATWLAQYKWRRVCIEFSLDGQVCFDDGWRERLRVSLAKRHLQFRDCDIDKSRCAWQVVQEYEKEPGCYCYERDRKKNNGVEQELRDHEAEPGCHVPQNGTFVIYVKFDARA
eukprot:TRINITY_DN11296_c0_g1_i1.p1 TRINITY_DN11296_c0_g1~~TRINITY_DN11296_c0_g1_i1.p1  ORF type:complete len:422 (+),score=60.25 TRINITY_DN11296_c0_g1_i1:67-1266(+)